MKHAIPAFALLSFSLLGCGKEAPAPVPPPSGSAVVPAAPKELAHELDTAKHEIPAQPVTGRLGGKPFTPDRIELDGNVLTFRQGNDIQLMLSILPSVPADAEFRTVTRADQKSTEAIPTVTVTMNAGGELKNENVNEGFALTLELGKPQASRVAGKVYLSLPGADKGVIAGTFTALHDRSTLAPPANTDKPYVTGAITQAAKPGATLIVGYARQPSDGQASFYDTIPTTIPAAGDPVGAVRANSFKPRSVTIRPDAEGKNIEYDLTKLPPGKYLVSARIEGGVPAWFVRDVKADSALTVPLTLPTGAAGSVDVDVPGLTEGTTVQVQVLPTEAVADDPTGQYEENAGLILGTWAILEKGKATIKQLPAGDFVVSARSAEVRYSGKVTVKAGETAKVELKPVP